MSIGVLTKRILHPPVDPQWIPSGHAWYDTRHNRWSGRHNEPKPLVLSRVHRKFHVNCVQQTIDV